MANANNQWQRKLDKLKLKNLLGSAAFGNPNASSLNALWIFVVGLLVWISMGFYVFQEAERGVVQRLGAYHSTVGPGLVWRAPGIDKVTRINVENVLTQRFSGTLLTEDENIVVVELVAQSIVSDPKDYLFNVKDPNNTLTQVMESALRKVIGQSKMDDIITTQQDTISVRTREEMEQILAPYNLGVSILSINLQSVKAPDAVREAFDDATRAREDEERTIKESETYARRVEREAEGQAQRYLEEAEAYRQEVIAKAQGEVARFAKMLPEYEAAPDVMRRRLYIETMEQVLGNVAKIMVDSPHANSLMYLPLDKMLRNQSEAKSRVDRMDEEPEPNYRIMRNKEAN